MPKSSFIKTWLINSTSMFYGYEDNFRKEVVFKTKDNMIVHITNTNGGPIGVNCVPQAAKHKFYFNSNRTFTRTEVSNFLALFDDKLQRIIDVTA